MSARDRLRPLDRDPSKTVLDRNLLTSAAVTVLDRLAACCDTAIWNVGGAIRRAPGSR